MLLYKAARVADPFQCLQNLLTRHHFVSSCADRRRLVFVIHFDCEHARCSTNGLYGLDPSPFAGHALDA